MVEPATIFSYACLNRLGMIGSLSGVVGSITIACLGQTFIVSEGLKASLHCNTLEPLSEKGTILLLVTLWTSLSALNSTTVLVISANFFKGGETVD